jgi:hypothetical protein
MEVEVLLGDKVIASTTTDTDNTYVASVWARDRDVVWLRASDGNGTTLATMLADLATLKARAGDSVLTQAEDINLVVSPLSTVLFAAMENGLDALPATRSQLVDAELRSRSYAPPYDLYAMAVVLNGIANESEPFPDGFDDTLDLARDAYALFDIPWQAKSQSENTIQTISEFEDAFAAMMSDERLLADLDLARYSLPRAYHDIHQQAHGLIGYGLGHLEFDPSGAGEYAHSSSWVDVPPSETTEWSVDGHFIKVRIDSPIVYSRWFTKESVADLSPDNESLQQQISNLPDGYHGHILIQELEHWLSILRRGVAADVTILHRLKRYDTSSWLAEAGLEGPDVERLELDSSLKPFVRSEALDLESLSEADVVGTWAFPLVWQADDYGLDSPGELETIETDALVTFRADRTAEASGGVLQTPIALTWRIDAEGQIEITFPDGSSQTSAVWARAGHEIGLFSTFRSSLGYDHTWYTPAIRWDGAQPAVALANNPGEYWQSKFGLLWGPAPNAEGSIHPESIYGFQLSADGKGARIEMWFPTDFPLFTTDRHWVTNPDRTVTIRVTKDPDGENRCDPTSPDCYVLRSRTWQPLVQLGDWLYVLEAAHFNARWFDSFNVEWDESDGRWELDGFPVDMSDQDYITYPRLNAYRVQTKPDLKPAL